MVNGLFRGEQPKQQKQQRQRNHDAENIAYLNIHGGVQFRDVYTNMTHHWLAMTFSDSECSPEHICAKNGPPVIVVGLKLATIYWNIYHTPYLTWIGNQLLLKTMKTCRHNNTSYQCQCQCCMVQRQCCCVPPKDIIIKKPYCLKRF